MNDPCVDCYMKDWDNCHCRRRDIVRKSTPAPGLVALKKLSDMWRHEATVPHTPQDEEEDKRNLEVEETLLQCADELDQYIKEVSN